MHHSRLTPLRPKTRPRTAHHKHDTLDEEWITPEQSQKDSDRRLVDGLEHLRISPNKFRKTIRFDQLQLNRRERFRTMSRNKSKDKVRKWNRTIQLPMNLICQFLEPKDICTALMIAAKSWYCSVATEDVWKHIYFSLNSSIKLGTNSYACSWKDLVQKSVYRTAQSLMSLKPPRIFMIFYPALSFSGVFNPNYAGEAVGFLNSKITFCLELLPRFFWIELFCSSNPNGNLRFGIVTSHSGEIVAAKGIEAFENYWVSVMMSGELSNWKSPRLCAVVLALMYFEAIPVSATVNSLVSHPLSLFDPYHFHLQLGLACTEETVTYLYGTPRSGSERYEPMERYSTSRLLSNFHDENLDPRQFGTAVLSFNNAGKLDWTFQSYPKTPRPRSRRTALATIVQ